MHLLFLKVIDQIEELLQPWDFIWLMDTCKSLMASEIHGISLFPDPHINNLEKYNSTVSLFRYLRFLFTWSDHSILRALTNFNSNTVQLLDEFDSLMDYTHSLVSYPIPDFSQDMIPSETSEYTLLAVVCNKELWQCSLQYVFNVKSYVVEKCDITQHCLQLIAIQNNPTIFYWTIPKCVIELIKNNTLKCLYSQGIVEVLIHPEQSLGNNNDVTTESLAFTTSKEKSFKEIVKVIIIL